jgi:uncharacterized membrane-anchored protein
MKSMHWVVFGVMVVAQLAVPFHMIANHEKTLQGGTAYKFRCGPVDPYDYFRGRYVALSFRDMTIENWEGTRFQRGDRAFALLGVDDEGFAKILDVTAAPPSSGDYLAVGAVTTSHGNSPLRVTLPFDKYFMNEFDAPAAETAYRDQSRSEEGAHVVVRVRDGQGTLDGLYFGDLPVEEYLRQEVATLPATTEVP